MPTTTVKSRTDLQYESLRTRLQSLAEEEDKTKALEELEGILKPSNPTKLPSDLQFKALDIRCSIHTTLGNLDLATKDGKALCRLQETNCKGYVRLAKILAKKGEVDRVTRLYDHALTILPAKNKDHDIVVALRAKWVAGLARRRKKCDMFEFLPAEILDEILSYMRFRDIVRFWGVSKSWHQYIENRPHFWRNIDLRDAKRPLTTKALIGCLKKSKGSVQELRLGQLQDPAFDKVVRLIGQAARFAKVLEFADLKRTMPVPDEFAESTGRLVGLRELYLSRTAAKDIAVILRNVKTLEVLEVKDVTSSEVDWEECTAQLKRLKVGKIVKGSAGQALELEKWAELFSLPSLKNLTSININTAPSETHDPLPLFCNLPNLTNLCLLSASPRRPFIDLPSTLTHLTINRNFGQRRTLIDPSLLNPEQPLFLSFPNLTHLNLSETTITFPEALILLRSSKPVYINLNGCGSCIFDMDEFKRVVDVGDVEDLYLEGIHGISDQYSLEFGPAPYTAKNFYGGSSGQEDTKRGFGKLKRVDLSFTQVTGIGFLNIVRNGRGERVKIEDGTEEELERERERTKLEWVRVLGCEGITYQAIEAVRKNDGVRIIQK